MSADRYTHTHQLMSYELVYTSIHSSIIIYYVADHARFNKAWLAVVDIIYRSIMIGR